MAERKVKLMKNEPKRRGRERKGEENIDRKGEADRENLQFIIRNSVFVAASVKERFASALKRKDMGKINQRDSKLDVYLHGIILIIISHQNCDCHLCLSLMQN